MIHKKTVFILGAGASKPYGFPTGKELSEGILANLNSTDKRRELQTLGFNTGRIDGFSISFLRSGTFTIDEFLEHNKDLRDIGKATIAQVLIGHENPITLHSRPENNGQWYRYLYGLMRNECNDLLGFAKNKVSFLTFNYDRSLEQFLYDGLSNTFMSNHDDVYASILKEIPVLHLHGKLGFLPWEKTGFYREYSTERNSGNLEHASQGIKIIHEAGDAEFVKARELLSKAERIYFLGFGYDMLSLGRLKITNLQGKRIMGTAIGLGKNERTRIINHGLHGGSLISADCLTFLKEENL